MEFDSIGQIIGWTGLVVSAIGGLVAVIRALIRGPKEDKALESEIQDRITAMAERWLEKAEKRLEKAEAQAQAAQAEAVEARAKAQAAEDRAQTAEENGERLGHRVTELETNLQSALATIEEVWSWGLKGGGEPKPVLPAWIYEWLYRDKG